MADAVIAACYRPSMLDAPAARCRFARLLAVASILLGPVAAAAPVLMISVDGLKPEYVLEASERGLKLPYLTSLFATGTYAEGVIGVSPTVTYPSHTTLVTGVAPALHGIVSNVEFDPLRQFNESWFWYAAQIRVPTLWHAAHAAHLRTASIGWPATVGARDIDVLIPEFWRVNGPAESLDPSDRHLLAALVRPVGLLSGLESTLGAYLLGNDTSLRGDEIKTSYALEILRTQHPEFMTLHLSSLDGAEHAHAPFSEAANRDLEMLDGFIASLAAAARAINPASTIVIVSDHGFVTLTHQVHLFVPFVRAGLVSITTDPATKATRIASWRAEPWNAGGMAAIMLKDGADRETEHAVGELLRTLAADPKNGIAKVEERADIERREAYPGAAFLVLFQPGYYAGSSLEGEVVTDVTEPHGGHGFRPEYPDMHAAFFIAGRGIGKGRNLGVIDMRQIAPTIAELLGVTLPGAASPLRLRDPAGPPR